MIKEMKMQQSIIDDEFETPTELYEFLCNKYQINPKLDASANKDNTKCVDFLINALHTEWIKPFVVPDWAVWCNPPHSLTLEFIARAESQYLKHNMDIMMIVPANVLSTEVWHKYIEGKREYHAIKGRPVFLKNGRKTKFPSRNAYVVIIWRKKV